MSGKAAKATAKGSSKARPKKPSTQKSAAKPRNAASRAGVGRKGAKATAPSQPGRSRFWLKLADLAIGLLMLAVAIWCLMAFLGVT